MNAKSYAARPGNGAFGRVLGPPGRPCTEPRHSFDQEPCCNELQGVDLREAMRDLAAVRALPLADLLWVASSSGVRLWLDAAGRLAMIDSDRMCAKVREIFNDRKAELAAYLARRPFTYRGPDRRLLKNQPPILRDGEEVRCAPGFHREVLLEDELGVFTINEFHVWLDGRWKHLCPVFEAASRNPLDDAKWLFEIDISDLGFLDSREQNFKMIRVLLAGGIDSDTDRPEFPWTPTVT